MNEVYLVDRGSIVGNYPVPEKLRGGVAVDIGANQGEWTEYRKDFFRIIHTYEPITMLASRIERKQIPNVTVFNEAVGDTSGTAELLMHWNRDSGSTIMKRCLQTSIVKKEGWSDIQLGQIIGMVDIETVLDRIGGAIDYLKMDCEGSEYLAFMGKDLSKIKYIGIELHTQLGEENWNKLGEWIGKTHSGFPDYNNECNVECLLIPK